MNINAMKEKRWNVLEDIKKMVETAANEERNLTSDERERRDKMMAHVQEMGKDIEAMEVLAQEEARNMKTGNPDPEKDKAEWRSLGEFVHAVVKNPNDKRLQTRVTNTLNTSEGSEGGFLVPEQFSDQILTVQPDEAIIRPRATIFGGGEADFKIPALQYSGNNMYAGATVTWIDEAGVKPQTDIDFKQITLQPYEVAAHIEVSDRLMRNSGQVETVVRTQLRNALISAEENAFLSGDGSGKPQGIIDAACTIGVTRGNNSAVSYDDICNMYARFRGTRGGWIISRSVVPELLSMQDSNNNLIWQPNARDSVTGTIFGMPVMISDHAPAMTETGSVVLADLKYYLIKDGVGVSIAASPHMKFTNNVTIIKAFKTVDGAPWLAGPLPTSYETSPFVQIENQ